MFLFCISLASQETEKDGLGQVDDASARRADLHVDVEVQDVEEEDEEKEKKQKKEPEKEKKQGEDEEGVKKQQEMGSRAEEEECRLVLRCFKSTLDRLFALLLKQQVCFLSFLVLIAVVCSCSNQV